MTQEEKLWAARFAISEKARKDHRSNASVLIDANADLEQKIHDVRLNPLGTVVERWPMQACVCRCVCGCMCMCDRMFTCVSMCLSMCLSVGWPVFPTFVWLFFSSLGVLGTDTTTDGARYHGSCCISAQGPGKGRRRAQGSKRHCSRGWLCPLISG